MSLICRHNRVKVVLVIIGLMLAFNPSLYAAVWSNLGFVALAKAFEAMPVASILRPQGFLQVNNETLKRAENLLAKSSHGGGDSTGEYGLGLVALAQGDMVNASCEFRATLQERGALAGMYLGYALYQQGKKDEALIVYLLSPETKVGLREQARSLLGRGLVNDALLLFEQIAAIAPDSVQAWMDLGEGYTNLGEWQRTAEMYDRALALEPKNAELLLRRAEVRFRLNSKDAASIKQEFERYLPDLRNIATFADELHLFQVYLLLAKLAQSQGNLDEAIGWQEQALALPRVEDRWTMVEIAKLYQSKGDGPQALVWMNRALVSSPNDPLMYSSLGYLLASQGDLPGSRHAYEKAIELAPQAISLHNGLAEVLLKMGERRLAAQEYRKVLEIDRSNQTALEGLKKADQVLDNQP